MLSVDKSGGIYIIFKLVLFNTIIFQDLGTVGWCLLAVQILFNLTLYYSMSMFQGQ
jgi:hypothetical protein